jgi:hypothetical protein
MMFRFISWNGWVNRPIIGVGNDIGKSTGTNVIYVIAPGAACVLGELAILYVLVSL